MKCQFTFISPSLLVNVPIALSSLTWLHRLSGKCGRDVPPGTSRIPPISTTTRLSDPQRRTPPGGWQKGPCGALDFSSHGDWLATNNQKFQILNSGPRPWIQDLCSFNQNSGFSQIGKPSWSNRTGDFWFQSQPGIQRGELSTNRLGIFRLFQAKGLSTFLSSGCG